MRRLCANCEHDEMAHNLDPMTLIAWCVNRATCKCPQFQPRPAKR